MVEHCLGAGLYGSGSPDEEPGPNVDGTAVNYLAASGNTGDVEGDCSAEYFVFDYKG